MRCGAYVEIDGVAPLWQFAAFTLSHHQVMPNPQRSDVLPMRDGVGPSCVALPHKGSGSMLDFLIARLPGVSGDSWRRRMQAGDVVDECGVLVMPDRPFEPGLRLFYYRSLDSEPALPELETVLYRDEHLLVADKPHFMPVIPAGRYLHSSLLVRLKRTTGIADLAPLHRIDRDTAGVMLFSIQRHTRGAYHSVFRDRKISKIYEAVAPWRPEQCTPSLRESRLAEADEFFRMQEVEGEPNSVTRLALKEHGDHWARYELQPVTGKRHQLRVHMAALGLPLRNDALYPCVNNALDGDWSRPLQLLARSLSFIDPLSGEPRTFISQRSLGPCS